MDTAKKETLIFWTINPDAEIRPTPTSDKPVYMPWVDPGTWSEAVDTSGGDPTKKRGRDDPAPDPGKEVYFMISRSWDLFRQLDANSEPKRFLGNINQPRILNVLRENASNFNWDINGKPGVPNDANVKKQNNVAGWADFFDRQFAIGQARARVIKAAIAAGQKRYARWEAVDINCQLRVSDDTGVFLSHENDTRRYGAVRTGIGFSLKSPGGIPPGRDAWYIKLRNNRTAKTLLGRDSGATKRGICKNVIFIERKTLAILQAGKYDWSDGSIIIRTGKGELKYLMVPDFKICDGPTWQEAFDMGTSQEQSFGSRSRNVAGLKLLFVVPSTASRINAADLKAAVDRAVKDARVLIKPTAEVVDQAGFTGALKTQYSRFLSSSPFGDYETWITEENYISYLTAYPGYVPPDVNSQTKLLDATKTLKPGDTAKTYTEDCDKKRAELTKKLDHFKLLSGPECTLQRVSNLSIVNAAKAGRKSFPGQNAQMGGSAKVFADACRWNSKEKVKSATDQARGLQWDAPGVTASEWLHRTAYSWGNANEPGMSQSASNFIFGSSEANSLMTRYEKAFQDLFKKQKSYDTKREEAGINMANCHELDGCIVAWNTDPEVPIVDYSLDTSGKTHTRKITKDKASAAIVSDDAKFRLAE